MGLVWSPRVHMGICCCVVVRHGVAGVATAAVSCAVHIWWGGRTPAPEARERFYDRLIIAQSSGRGGVSQG
jgi:hypothetical protein